jgi:diacylglycerol kinase (ATP)
VKPTRLIDSVNCAIEGILYAVKTQRHMRNHFLIAVVLFTALLIMRVSALEFTLIAICVSFVLFAELINTAIEVAVDLVSPDYHPLAKLAKDISAGAVLIAAIGATVMGYLILYSYIFPVYKETLSMIGTPTEMGTVVSILVVTIAVVIMKTIIGKGTPLRGGLPSGHSAIAFSIATIVSLTTMDPVSSLLTLALAIMVSHSRLLLKLHSTREVALGAGLGVALTLAVLLLFRLFARVHSF